MDVERRRPSASAKAKKDFKLESYRARDFLSIVFLSRKLWPSGPMAPSTNFLRR